VFIIHISVYNYVYPFRCSTGVGSNFSRRRVDTVATITYNNNNIYIYIYIWVFIERTLVRDRYCAIPERRGKVKQNGNLTAEIYWRRRRRRFTHVYKHARDRSLFSADSSLSNPSRFRKERKLKNPKCPPVCVGENVSTCRLFVFFYVSRERVVRLVGKTRGN